VGDKINKGDAEVKKNNFGLMMMVISIATPIFVMPGQSNALTNLFTQGLKGMQGGMNSAMKAAAAATALTAAGSMAAGAAVGQAAVGIGQVQQQIQATKQAAMTGLAQGVAAGTAIPDSATAPVPLNDLSSSDDIDSDDESKAAEAAQAQALKAAESDDLEDSKQADSTSINADNERTALATQAVFGQDVPENVISLVQQELALADAPSDSGVSTEPTGGAAAA